MLQRTSSLQVRALLCIMRFLLSFVVINDMAMPLPPPWWLQLNEIVQAPL